MKIMKRPLKKLSKSEIYLIQKFKKIVRTKDYMKTKQWEKLLCFSFNNEND